MCRWFAYISNTEECLIEDVLITPKHGLTQQVNEHYLPRLLSHDPAVHAGITTENEISERNRHLNNDGFGMTWYSAANASFTHGENATTGSTTEGDTHPALHPAMYKTSQPPAHDATFLSLASNVSTLVLFAHIRATSSAAVVPVNNHPFVWGIHSFMHNGFITDFLAIKRQMCLLMSDAAYNKIHGGTDTEHLAALYITLLTGQDGEAGFMKQYSTAQMKAALQTAFDTVITLQAKVVGAEKVTASSLNCAVTDGVHFVAVRYRDHPTEQPPSLYWSTNAGVTLNRKYPDHPNGGENSRSHKDKSDHGSHVIVASEPSTYNEEEWTLMEKNTALMFDESGQITFEKMSVLGKQEEDVPPPVPEK